MRSAFLAFVLGLLIAPAAQAATPFALGPGEDPYGFLSGEFTRVYLFTSTDGGNTFDAGTVVGARPGHLRGHAHPCRPGQRERARQRAAQDDHRAGRQALPGQTAVGHGQGALVPAEEVAWPG